MSVRILLIDDDVELCSLLDELLKREHFQVEMIHDGQHGLERALSGAFDLVVLDVMLPRLDGFEVLRQLRRSSLIPVLMLTARGEDIDRVVGLEPRNSTASSARPLGSMSSSARSCHCRGWRIRRARS